MIMRLLEWVLTMLLNTNPEMQVIGEASEGNEGIKKAIKA